MLASVNDRGVGRVGSVRLVVTGLAALTTGLAVLMVAAASPAWADNFYYPNTTADTSNLPATTCAQGSAYPCSLRDAVTLAGNSSIDSSVVLTAGTTYDLTGGYLPISGTMGNPPHTVTIYGNGATIDASGNGGDDAMAGGDDSIDVEDLAITGDPLEALGFDGSGAVTLEDDTFSDNGSSSENGVPVLIEQAGSLTMQDDTFTGNQGASEAGLEVDSVTGAATLSELTFTNNQGDALEVGISGPSFGSLSMDHLVFRHNVGKYAGTVSINSGSTPASVSDIDAENNSGGKYVRSTMAFYGHFTTLDDITSANNTLDNAGAGAILSPTSTVTATNWTVTGNTSTAGPSSTGPAEAGGVDVVGGSVRLNHATIANNTAGGNADDLHTSGSGTVTVLNSIIDGSSAGGAVPCAADGGPITSGGHNIDRGSSCGFTAAGDMSNTDPRLGALVQTFPVSTLPLTYGSPAVDAADNPNCPLTDAIGTPRPIGAGCDIGAFESPQTNLAVSGTGAPSQVRAGHRVTYTFTISNLSGTVPQGEQFTDTLPPGAVAVSATSSSGTCTTGAQTRCTLPGVHRGGDVTITVVAKLTRAGPNADTAHVQSELPDSEMSNDNATVTTNVTGGARLSGLRVSPRRFRARAGRHRGATIHYADTIAGRVTFTVLRAVPGVRLARRCVAGGRHAPRGGRATCKRLVSVGGFEHTGQAGSNSVPFSGRVGGHQLKPGAYQLRVAQRGARSITAPFSIER
jgi:uncharacterized repeat protein (TIGR01451 family)